MHKEGHIGIGMIIYSPIAYLLLEYEISVGFGLGLAAICFWSFAPDADLELPLRHRGPTHTLWAAAIAGVATAAVGIYFVYQGTALTPSLRSYVGAASFGFFIGFLGVVGHLVGDSFTKMGITPWWPHSNRTVGMRIIYASNERVNQGLGTAGGLCLAGAAVLASL